MTSQRVVQFEYRQSLVQESGAPHWSEELTISVRILAEAITSGWLREHFAGRGGAHDFLVLLAIAMHARPLRGNDLAYLIRVGLASGDDENRLYARVSDLALASELGAHRKTIAASAQRLAAKGFIAIREIRQETAFRDSHGRFSGSKIYLLAGDLHNRFVVKDIEPHRGHLTATAKPPTVANEVPHRGSSRAINIKDDEEEEGSPLPPAEIVFRHFAVRQGARDYKPRAREEKALHKLLADGYSLPGILAGIDRAFAQQAGQTPIRQFTFCVPVIRDAAPDSEDSDLRGDTDSHPNGEAAPHNRDAAPKPGDAPSPPDRLPMPEQVLQTFKLAAGELPTATERQRLQWLVEECSPTAQDRGEDPWDWAIDALKESTGRADNLLAYTIAVMRKRARSQPAPPNTNQTSAHIRHPRKKPRKSADPALATAQAFQHLFPSPPPENPDGTA